MLQGVDFIEGQPSVLPHTHNNSASLSLSSQGFVVHPIKPCMQHTGEIRRTLHASFQYMAAQFHPVQPVLAVRAWWFCLCEICRVHIASYSQFAFQCPTLTLLFLLPTFFPVQVKLLGFVCSKASYLVPPAKIILWAYPPPPFVVPHPLSFPGGGGGPTLGQPKIFHCGSLCCCVGDCVVGHCHLYPLHSWQDILLTFAEMELDSTTMFPPGTSVMFIRSTGEPFLAQVVGHSEHGDPYCRITYDHASHCHVLPLRPACTVVVRSPRGGWGTVTW